MLSRSIRLRGGDDAAIAEGLAGRAIALSRRPRIVLLFIYGQAAATARHRVTALDAVASMRANFPNDRWCDYACAQMLSTIEPVQAIAILEGLRANHEDYMPYFALLGNCYVAAQDLRTAQKTFREGLAKFPESADLISDLGKLQAMRGNWSEARKLFERAVELAPTDLIARLNLSGTLLNLNASSEAEQRAREALVIAPDSTSAHTALGNALRVQGRVEEAEAELHAAIGGDPEDATANFALGLILAGRNDWEHAIASFETATRRRPDAIGRILALEDGYQSTDRRSATVDAFFARLRTAESRPATR